jgi:excisionase family DNA binding protein
MGAFDTIAHTLDEADAAASNADMDTVRAKLGQLRALVGPDQLLTTGEAATVLGIRSVNTVKALARAGKIPFLQEPGKQMRLPLAGVLDFKARRDFQNLAASEQLHNETADLGSDVIPQEALDDLAPAPGSLPWQRQ